MLFLLASVSLLLTAASVLYIKRDPINKLDNINLIVVLSGKNKYITNFRLKQALKLYKPPSSVAICGKDMSAYMKSKLQSNGVKNVLVQDKSTNTLEDAKYLSEMFPETNKKNFVLISSLSHQRRAYNTFRKVFNKDRISNSPAWQEFFSWYSPLIVTGWIATGLNMYKDYKHNR